MESPLTTHALNTASGLPAAGLRVSLFQQLEGCEEVLISEGKCNEDGRVKKVIRDPSLWKKATYRLRFETGEYFASQNQSTFYPYCDVTFRVDDLASHFHVPLLLSPFGFTTYRGS